MSLLGSSIGVAMLVVFVANRELTTTSVVAALASPAFRYFFWVNVKVFLQAEVAIAHTAG